MSVNILLRVSRSVVFCIGSLLFLALGTFAVTLSAVGAESSDFLEVFCGSPIPAVHKTVTRPPVKSAHRTGVAPRESSDGKGRARSPHPACGRFEAAHCAAHLATISASGPSPAAAIARRAGPAAYTA